MLNFLSIFLIILNLNFIKVESIIYENLYDVNVNLAQSTIDINLINKTYSNINCTAQSFVPTTQTPVITYEDSASCRFLFDKSDVDYKLTVSVRSANGIIRSIQFEKELLFDLYETDRLYTCTIHNLTAQYNPADNTTLDINWSVYDGFTNKKLDINDLKYFQFHLKYCTALTSPINSSASEAICKEDMLFNQTSYNIHKEAILPGKLYTIQIILLKLNTTSQIHDEKIIVYSKPDKLDSYSYQLNSKNLTINWNVTSDMVMVNYFTLIRVLKPSNLKDTMFAVPLINRQSSFAIDNIMAGKLYEISLSNLIVDTFNNVSVESEPVTFSFTTRPKEPTDLEIITKTPTYIWIAWSKSDALSLLDYFEVNLYIMHNQSIELFESYKTNKNEMNLTDLTPANHYQVTITSVLQTLKSEKNLTAEFILKPEAPIGVLEYENATAILISWYFESNSTARYNYMRVNCVDYSSTNVSRELLSLDIPQQAATQKIMLKNFSNGGKIVCNLNSVYETETSYTTQVIYLTHFQCPHRITIFNLTQTASYLSIDEIQSLTDGRIHVQLTSQLDGSVYNYTFPKNSRVLEMANLSSATPYSLMLTTNSFYDKELYCDRFNKTFYTRPKPVVNARVSKTTSDSAFIEWNSPEAVRQNNLTYMIRCENIESISDVKTQLRCSGDFIQGVILNETATVLQKLYSFAKYRISISTIAFGVIETDKAVFLTFETTYSESSPVRNIKIDFIKCADCQINAKLTWSPPELQNGIIKSYLIKYIGKNIENQKTHTPDVIRYEVAETDKSMPSYLLTDFYGGYTYQISIQAINQAGNGAPTTLNFDCPAYKPLNNNRTIDLEKVVQTPQTITIWLEKSLFSEKNGEITHFQVIVSEVDDSSNSINDSVLVGYNEAKTHDGVWPSFYTQDKQIWFDKFKSHFMKTYRAVKSVENITTAFSYVIGEERVCVNEQIACNGPLKASTSYRIKIRGFNKADYVDTPYSDIIRTPRLPNNSNTMTTIVSVVVSICVIAIVCAVIAFVILKCRHSAICLKRANPVHGSSDGFLSKSASGFSVPMFFGNSSGSHSKNATIDASTLQTSIGLNQLSKTPLTNKPIKIAQFEDHVSNLGKNSDYMFAIEFETFKDIGTSQEHSAAELPINRLKNRFTNILPYDSTRVKLQTATDAAQDGSDYINGNYIPGHNSTREFIATQGPLSTTKNDFWKMCFDCNVKGIVMLTKCLEGNRERCERYWPLDATPVLYGNIEVTVLSEKPLGEWNISEMKLTRNGKSIRIWHYHYTMWPDFKVPDNPRSLINFIRIFRQTVRYGDQPIIVHCSAGVGRTGTFIALDIIMQQIDTCESIDIYGLVYEMRKHRVQMVQTEAQYIYLHQCVVALLNERKELHTSVNFFDNFAFQSND